eukprot:615386-Amphidinium_carterae.1
MFLPLLNSYGSIGAGGIRSQVTESKTATGTEQTIAGIQSVATASFTPPNETFVLLVTVTTVRSAPSSFITPNRCLTLLKCSPNKIYYGTFCSKYIPQKRRFQVKLVSKM